MKLETAVSLIEKAVAHSEKPQHWMDLGAGTGLFTTALSSLLPLESSILAIDKDEKALKAIKVSTGITLRVQVLDFTAIASSEKFDGILMANALHYVSDSLAFLKHLRSISRRLIIVEYERTTPNRWVPYPTDFEKLRSLGRDAGFSSVVQLKEVPSVYDSVSIYSAVLS